MKRMCMQDSVGYGKSSTFRSLQIEPRNHVKDSSDISFLQTLLFSFFSMDLFETTVGEKVITGGSY